MIHGIDGSIPIGGPTTAAGTDEALESGEHPSRRER